MQEAQEVSGDVLEEVLSEPRKRREGMKGAEAVRPRPVLVWPPALPARGGPLLEEFSYTLPWSYRLHVRLRVGVNFGAQQFEQLFGGVDVDDEDPSALAAKAPGYPRLTSLGRCRH